MSSESNTERLIDLMYGESTDQEKERFLEEIAESSALQRERAEIRTLLGDVSEVWPNQSVSANLHNSIMDAAKAATNERAEKKLFVTPIKPGLWSRLRSSSQIGQVAMVATVVIAGAFVFRFVNLDEKANIHEEMTVSIPDKSEIQPKFASKIEVGEKEAFGYQTSDGNDKITDNIAEAKVGTIKAQDSALAKAPAPKKEVSKKRPSKASKKRVARKLQSKKDKGGKRNPSSSRSSGKSAAPSSGIAQNKAYFDQLTNTDDSEQDSKDAYQERVDNAEKLTLVPAKTIDSVSSKYSARDYSGTIQAADEFVKLKSGTRNERARALQLKAQSLANLGRNLDALRVYDSILKNYKTFQSTAISSARAEISRKLEERRPAEKNRKAKTKKKSNYDFDAESIQSK